MTEVFHNVSNGSAVPITQSRLPSLYPGRSFGDFITNETLEELGLVRIPFDVEPNHQPWQTLIKNSPKKINGEWLITYTVIDKPVDDLRIKMLNDVEVNFSKTILQLTGDSSVEERDTWKAKEESAREFLNGTASESQVKLLQLESYFTSEDITELAENIVSKASKFYQVVGLASGVKRSILERLKKAETGEELFAALEFGRDQEAKAFEMLSNA